MTSSIAWKVNVGMFGLWWKNRERFAIFWKSLFTKDHQHCSSEEWETLFNYEAISKGYSYSLCSHGCLIIIVL